MFFLHDIDILPALYLICKSFRLKRVQNYQM